jgi:predicted DsbA family dithiol-disulfide isomerase
MLRIDPCTDITCPWCIIGQRRLDKVLVERFPDIDVDIRSHKDVGPVSAPPTPSRSEEAPPLAPNLLATIKRRDQKAWPRLTLRRACRHRRHRRAAS